MSSQNARKDDQKPVHTHRWITNDDDDLTRSRRRRRREKAPNRSPVREITLNSNVSRSSATMGIHWLGINPQVEFSTTMKMALILDFTAINDYDGDGADADLHL